MFLVEVDDLDGARLALDRGRRASEELGARWNLPLYAWASAWVRFVAGAWDDAWAECEASVSLARELGTRHGVLLAHCLQGIIGLHRGELERAERAVAAAEAEFAATGPQHGLENVMVWVRALLAEAHGDVATAVQVLGQAWEELSAAGVAGYRVDLGPDLVRLALANGDLGRAEAVTAEVEQVAHLNPGLGRTDGAALHCRGLVAASPELLAKGFAVLEGCARPFEAARVAEDAAGALARAGDRDQARRHCEAALRRYEGLEAWRSVARTEASMRAYGLRRGSRARRARPVTGWESLTATERSVAELAARGLTNPQIAQRLFVSRHTVHTHLSHVLAKLQLSSRVELAGAAAVRRVQKLGQDPEQVQPAGERDGHPPVDVHAP